MITLLSSKYGHFWRRPKCKLMKQCMMLRLLYPLFIRSPVKCRKPDVPCVCVCVQAHVYGHAWRPEDKQPHSDEHHAGSLHGRPQNPWGVSDSFTERLTNSIHSRASVHTDSSRGAFKNKKHTNQQQETQSCCLMQDPGRLWSSPPYTEACCTITVNILGAFGRYCAWQYCYQVTCLYLFGAFCKVVLLHISLLYYI